MLRVVVSLIILIVLLTYLAIPLVKLFKKFYRKEIERIDSVFNEDEDNN